MIRIITFAWGSYTWLIKPCIEALRRQWVGPFPDAMTVMTDDMSMPGVWPLNPGWREDNFSNRLADLLNDVSEPIIFWTTPDAFWLDIIDGHVIETLANYMLREGNVVRVSLHHVLALDKYRKVVRKVDRLMCEDDVTLVTCSEPKHCSLVSGLGMGVGLFNRKLLLELIEPGWTLWDIERHGTRKMLDTRHDLTSLALYPGWNMAEVCHQGELRDLSPLPSWLVNTIREAQED